MIQETVSSMSTGSLGDQLAPALTEGEHLLDIVVDPLGRVFFDHKTTIG